VAVRVEALALRVKLDRTSAAQIAAQALARGALPEKQAALRILDEVPGAPADDVLLRLLDDLLGGRIEAGMVLDLLESAAKRKSPAIAERLARYEAGRPSGELAPFRETLAGGDARAGAQVFHGRAELGCQRCHALEGHGTEVGPELAGIGARRSRAYLLESIVHPSKHFPPGFESALITVKDGQTHGGTIRRETATTISLRTPDGAIVGIAKASIRSRERGVSAMPEGFGQILSKRDLRDLVAWLASLKR
jgi:quinoprotein glucose dehydrogenase